MTSIEDLPDEVLSDIFIRLLAKQLAQMRCVCKPWNALLTDSSFIRSHLNRSIQHKNNDEILLFFEMCFSFELHPKPFTARPSRSPNLELTNFIKPPPIPKCKYGCGVIIGSVNGLICFAYISDRLEFSIRIWNPSLSAILSLPPSSLPSPETLFVVGFGFDPKCDDYKVLKLTCFSTAPYKVKQAEVYSMRKGSWKLISLQTFPSLITFPEAHNSQICVDDHLHWLCDTHLDRKREAIVGFDLGEEVFFEIPLPDSIPDFNVYFNVLGALGGKLCVMSCVEGGECEVWMMEEYGVAGSWVKHHVFSQFSGDIIPYGFTLKNEFLFQVDQDDDRFGLYDPIAAKTKTFKIMSRSSPIMKFVEYVDSLVWVPPPKHEIKVSNFFKLTKTIFIVVCMIQLLPRLKPLRHQFSKYLFGS